MSKKPLVSVLCMTYNQVKYVRQALDGFIMQATDFDFEVIVHDDASSDGTREIIEEYHKKYPELIKPILQKENQYSKGVRGILVKYLLPKAQAKYIAICEGDDYWTDPSKLQLQVEFLEKNPKYSGCFHPVNVIYEDKEEKNFVFPDIKNEKWYTIEELLKTNYIPTNSILYRKRSYEQFPSSVMPFDWFFHLYHGQYGAISYIDKIMSVYRKHSKGIWWEYDRDRQKIWKIHGIDHLAMQNELLKIYGENPEYRKIIQDNIDRLLEAFMDIDDKYKTHLLADSLNQFPSHGHRLLMHYINEAKILSAENQRIHEETQNLLVNTRKLENRTKELHKQLEDMRNSTSWKVTAPLRNLVNRVQNKRK